MGITSASAKGLGAVIAKEAIVPIPYYDSVGVLTIFIGHTAAAGSPNPKDFPKGVEQPLAKAFEVFVADAVKFERRVARTFKTNRQYEFDAAFSFDYNTGAVDRATWVKTHNAGNTAKAAEQMMNWSKPPEIIPRRQAEQRIYRDGSYPPAKAALIPADSSGRVLWSRAKQIDLAPILPTLRSAKDDSVKADKAKLGTVASGAGAGGTGGGTEVMNQLPELAAGIPDWGQIILTLGFMVGVLGLAFFGIRWFLAYHRSQGEIQSAAATIATNLQESPDAEIDFNSLHLSSTAISPRQDQ